jgi:N-acetylmuramoyl-L-alanine amidase
MHYRPTPGGMRVMRGTAGGLRLLAVVVAAALALGAAEPERIRFETVVVDAGHGGDDHGARGVHGLLEKDLTLDLARRLAGELRRRGLHVVMTREDDRFLSLEERTSRANDAGGQLFISIHANASKARGARGIETFFASLEASDEAAQRLAEIENRAFAEAGNGGPAPGDPLLAILGDLIATEHLVESQEFARMAQHRLATGEAARSRGVKQAPFVVLMGVRMPAVLVEVGFLTNPSEERALGQETERTRLTGGLADAVEAYRARYDARHGRAERASGGRAGP